jgi:hypothetical protein
LLQQLALDNSRVEIIILQAVAVVELMTTPINTSDSMQALN